ncbi:MAG TPA: GntR family transcriptional regulator [Yaniella sp.]
MLQIDPGAELPPYEQLRRQLIEQIQTGQLPQKTRLPAVRRLAADLGIAPGTVARAYKELESEGYLVTRGRHGTTVAAQTLAEHGPEAHKLTVQYVESMRQLGVAADEIVAAVHRALLAE